MCVVQACKKCYQSRGIIISNAYYTGMSINPYAKHAVNCSCGTANRCWEDDTIINRCR